MEQLILDLENGSRFAWADCPHNPSDADRAFRAWLDTPPGGEVANRFLRLAIGMHRRGFRHFGSKAICERLRWHYVLRYGEQGAADYKINNNHTSRLARWAESRAPELRDFFRKRGLTT